MIGILNYKMGNLQSIKNSLDYLGIPSRIVDSPAETIECDQLILPGVGAFGLAMQQLHELDLVEPIKKIIEEGRPLLGICLGMQLLLESSEEHGHHEGLGLIKGRVLPFEGAIDGLPIPHVGWNNISKKKESAILKNIGDSDSFYFVHSFYCDLVDKNEVVATTDYGFDFDSIIQSGNIIGCQFHPEKSQRAGLSILVNFSKMI